MIVRKICGPTEEGESCKIRTNNEVQNILYSKGQIYGTVHMEGTNILRENGKMNRDCQNGSNKEKT